MSGVPIRSAESVSINQAVVPHPVTALTLGRSYVDANPEQQEEDPKAHEK